MPGGAGPAKWCSCIRLAAKVNGFEAGRLSVGGTGRTAIAHLRGRRLARSKAYGGRGIRVSHPRAKLVETQLAAAAAEPNRLAPLVCGVG